MSIPVVCISCGYMIGDKIKPYIYLYQERMKVIRETMNDPTFDMDIEIPSDDILNELKVIKPCCVNFIVSSIQK